jgi:HK97 family phage prohead protease
MNRLEWKSVQIDVKAASSGLIEGYASRFGQIDQGGDMVVRGAYSASLMTKASNGIKIKMLWQHDPSQPIGVWDALSEDETGLYVKGRLLPSVAKAKEVQELVESGAVDGLSIGYKTIRSERGQKGERILKELDLWEVSVVTFPMQQSARIDAIKAADMSERDMEELLTQDAGLSRSIARKLMAGGFDAIRAKQDAGTGIGDLAQFMREMKSQNGGSHVGA